MFILTIVSFIFGILLITFFYNLSSNLKNFYLEQKIKYTLDGKYLAVITNNGLWIKDIVEKRNNIINASKIDQNLLFNVFITEFDENFEVERNIKSEKVDVQNKLWTIHNASIYEKNGKAFVVKTQKKITLKHNLVYNIYFHVEVPNADGIPECKYGVIDPVMNVLPFDPDNPD